MAELKEVGKCVYCGDPIYEYQKVDDNKEYHEGCCKIRDAEKLIKSAGGKISY